MRWGVVQLRQALVCGDPCSRQGSMTSQPHLPKKFHTRVVITESGFRFRPRRDATLTLSSTAAASFPYSTTFGCHPTGDHMTHNATLKNSFSWPIFFVSSSLTPLHPRVLCSRARRPQQSLDPKPLSGFILDSNHNSFGRVP